MNDEQFFLANAYLDGELTAEEQRIAEADPDVMSEVEQLRALQAELRDVPRPEAAVREAAIGAAMSEFGRAVDPAPVPSTPSVVPYRPRPASARYLAIAAAIVAVFGLGVVISQANIGGGDDDDAAPAASEATAEATFEQLGDAQIAADAADAADGSDTAAADEPAEEMVEEAADEPEDTADSAVTENAGGVGDESTAEAAAEPAAADEDAATAPLATIPANQRVSVPPTFDPDQPIRDEDDLGVYGAYLLGLRDDGALEPTPNTACVGDFAILEAATLLIDTVVVDVFVAVDEFEGIVSAVDPDECLVLLEASLT